MDKTEVEVIWTPAMNIMNQVQFSATIVQSFNMIWMAQSNIIAVGGGVVPPIVPPTIPTTVSTLPTPNTTLPTVPPLVPSLDPSTSTPAGGGGIPTETPLFQNPNDAADAADAAKATGYSSTVLIIIIVLILVIVFAVLSALFMQTNKEPDQVVMMAETMPGSTSMATPIAMPMPMVSKDQVVIQSPMVVSDDQVVIKPAMMEPSDQVVIEPPVMISDDQVVRESPIVVAMDEVVIEPPMVISSDQVVMDQPIVPSDQVAIEPAMADGLPDRPRSDFTTYFYKNEDN